MKSYSETPQGMLMIADGFSAVDRWDGLTAATEAAGLAAPTTQPAMAVTGTGLIVGTYYAYVRFLDRLGFASNLSPISAKLVASSSTKSITGATNATPIVVTTSAVHGLADGNKIKISGVGGNLATNGTWFVDVLTTTTFALYTTSALTVGVRGTGTYNGGGTVYIGSNQINYTSIQVPSDSKVTKRQILRNTDGQITTLYVDVEDTTLVGTTFSSTKDDDTLAAQESVPLFSDEGDSLAERHGVPPNHKPYLAYHLGRMFAAGELAYTRGMVKVTNASATVTGVGTAWTSAMAERNLYVVGSAAAYTISSVNTTLQTLTLSTTYQGNTDKFALYAIRSIPEERKRVAWSAAGLPESWLVTDAIDIQEDGDEITGLLSLRSFLYIVEKRHVYKFTFENDPVRDGVIFLSANRGCINHRSWVAVDDAAYMLDEFGVHRFVGNAQSEQMSTMIQDIFRPDSDSPWKINWRARKWFHAVLYRPQETIRWFVALAGMRVPRHALCFNYRLKRWWIEDYRDKIGGAIPGDINGVPYVFLGGQSRTFHALWQGTTDTVNASLGTVRGTVTSAGPTWIADTAAVYPTATVVNSPCAIVSGKGKGQIRRIVSVSGTTLNVDLPWLVKPDTTSEYQIGGVSWLFKSSWFRMANQGPSKDENYQRRLELIFAMTESPATMDLRLFYNFQAAPEVQRVTKSSTAGNGVATTKDKSDIVIDLTTVDGIVQHQMPHSREYYTRGKRYAQFSLSGFTNQDPCSIYECRFEGVENPVTVEEE